MSAVSIFLWGLVGVDIPEREATQARFTRSLREHDAADANLDDVMRKLQSINRRARVTTELNRTMMDLGRVNQDTPEGVETG